MIKDLKSLFITRSGCPKKTDAVRHVNEAYAEQKDNKGFKILVLQVQDALAEHPEQHFVFISLLTVRVLAFNIQPDQLHLVSVQQLNDN